MAMYEETLPNREEVLFNVNFLREEFKERLKYEPAAVDLDLDGIVKALGGEITSGGIDDQAQLEKVGDKEFKIILSNKYPQFNRNFTIAHELGHLLMDWGYLKGDYDWVCINPSAIMCLPQEGRSVDQNIASESAANFFAFEVVMPNDLFKTVVEKYTESGKFKFDKIADYFKCSVSLVLRRGKDLNIWEVA